MMIRVHHSDGVDAIVASPGPSDPKGLLAADILSGLKTLNLSGTASLAGGSKTPAGGEHSTTLKIE